LHISKEGELMNVLAHKWLSGTVLTIGSLAASAVARAQPPAINADDAVRYLALGDSIAAGYKVAPVTQAYPYLLYEDGAFDQITSTLFCNAAVPGATSTDVLVHQVPQALIPFAEGGFHPDNITLTVGGNDLLAILKFAATHQDQAEIVQFANQVLVAYGQNLGAILVRMRSGLPNAKIFVANQYTVPEIEAVLPLTGQIIGAFNNVLAQVAGQFPTNVYVVDIYHAFLGRKGLLLVERHGASPIETHLTTTGHRVMEQAFADVISQHK
jgi:lysophospholipase L1-like esterase